MKKIILSACAVGTIAGMSACGSSISTSADKPASSGTAKAAAKAAPAHMGQPITLKGNTDGEKITVTPVGIVDPATTTSFIKPDAGQRWVAVQFTLANVGTKAYDDSPSNGTKVLDAEGQQYNSALADTIAAGPLLPADTKIVPGGTAKGYIVYQVGAAAKITAVQFALDSGFGGTGQWSNP